MDIRRLRYFIAVAETLSFSRAAQNLGMTQSPVSQRVRELEIELKGDLLVRGKRGLSLTPLGEKLLDLGRPLVQEFDRLIKPASDTKPYVSVRNGTLVNTEEAVAWAHLGSSIGIMPAYALPVLADSNTAIL